MAPPRIRDDPPARRGQILDHAIRVIGERGYYGFTVQELAKACGLSNAGLLHHFPSKEHLFLASLQELEDREAEIMSPLVAAAERGGEGAGAKRAVLELLRTMVVRSTAQPQRLRLFAELHVEALDPQHPAHGWSRERERVVTELFAKLLWPHVEEPVPVARLLLAMMDGFCVRWLWAEQAFDAVAEWDRAVARLLPELAAPGG